MDQETCASVRCAENETRTHAARSIRDTIALAKKGAQMNAEPAKQTILITGATDGLGKAAALLLAERGYRVFAAGRSPEKRAQLDARARQQKMPLESLEMDVCDDGSVQRAVASVYQKTGAIDVLINNAGFVQVGAVEDLCMEDWRRQFETNFFGVIRVSQAVLPRMRERRSGRILMMSSISGFVTPPTQGAYSASKHAIEALSNALRHELYPFGIHTILIQPGYIMTNIQTTAMALVQPHQEKFKTGPYARIYASYLENAAATRAHSKTTPEDCARVILKAIEAPRPKARYGVTSLATFAKIAEWLLTDTAADRLIRRRYGISRED
jgi:NAD(P)-dependent dehydrogenase (short-subunit alcohol dehydrogenase family)